MRLKVGLVTYDGSISAAAAIAFTNVVLPAPNSPSRATKAELGRCSAMVDATR